MVNRKQQIREQAENSLEAFIRLVHPQRVLGHIHIELINWWEREDAKSHQLVLLPRDHGKSAMVAYRVAQAITKNPAIRVMYLSSTSNLAQKQLKFIQDILISDIYRSFWPEMVNKEESRRELWTKTEFAVDHPLRKVESIRDPTVFIGGLTTGLTGMHCDIAVLDDVVVKENAYTQEGRDKVSQQYSLLASIEASDAQEWVVGTRYYSRDLYYDISNIGVEEYDDEGEIIAKDPLYEVFERKVEDRGDGTGQFLWPRQVRADGKEFGFNQKILARKRAQYLDKTQFRAQYYNDPNDTETAAIQRDLFQYYEPGFIKRKDGKWFFKDERLNLFAAVDFAYSLSRRADYTCIVVIGVDRHHNYYVLDIDRFKTQLISDYFSHILALHRKWDFRKLRAEVTSGQLVIVRDLKDNYIKRHGLALSIDDYKPTRHSGTKEERIEATLQPRYQNRQIWHYQGGNCQILEEELVLQHPPHDDVKDALTCAIDVAVPPANQRFNTSMLTRAQMAPMQSRFGGFA